MRMKEEFSPKRGMRMEMGNILYGEQGVVKYHPVNPCPVVIPKPNQTAILNFMN
jgi:hypothetical protein